MAKFFDLYNRFWDMYLEEPFSATETSLYMFLLYKWNVKGRPNIFEYPNRRIVLELSIDESTLIKIRNVLQQKGVLKFKGGRRKAQSPMYILAIGEVTDEELNEDLYLDKTSKTPSKPPSKTPSKPPSKTPSIYIEDIENKSNRDIISKSDDLDESAHVESKIEIEMVKTDEPSISQLPLDLTNEEPRSEEILIQTPPPNDDAKKVKRVVDLWHTLCPSFGRLIKVSDQRKHKILIRLTEMGSGEKAFDVLTVVFTKLEASKFCKGDSNGGWKATFDWLFTNGSNWVKVYEGNYDNKDNSQALSNGQTQLDPRRGIDAGHKKQKDWGASL